MHHLHRTVHDVKFNLYDEEEDDFSWASSTSASISTHSQLTPTSSTSHVTAIQGNNGDSNATSLSKSDLSASADKVFISQASSIAENSSTSASSGMHCLLWS